MKVTHTYFPYIIEDHGSKMSDFDIQDEIFRGVSSGTAPRPHIIEFRYEETRNGSQHAIMLPIQFIDTFVKVRLEKALLSEYRDNMTEIIEDERREKKIVKKMFRYQLLKLIVFLYNLIYDTVTFQNKGYKMILTLGVLYLLWTLI